jgi:hypothetical protein
MEKNAEEIIKILDKRKALWVKRNRNLQKALWESIQKQQFLPSKVHIQKLKKLTHSQSWRVNLANS